MPPLAAAVYCFPPRHAATRDADATRAITRDDIIARCAAITPFAAMLTPSVITRDDAASDAAAAPIRAAMAPRTLCHTVFI
jgi:hypothetical protein